MISRRGSGWGLRSLPQFGNSEFLAFRHLFRGASIVLMRWEKLMPLLARVDLTYKQTEAEIGRFVRFIEAGAE